MIRIRLASLALAAAVAWALPPSARAHGTGARLLQPGDTARSVLFHYSSGEPMAWVRIKVFAPQGPGEFVIARTDPNGIFAFVPDGPGLWRVEAQDDEGHKAVIDVHVDASFAAAGPESTAAGTPGQTGEPQVLPPEPSHGRERNPLVLRALLGISLIGNLFLGLAFARKRQTRP